MRRWARASYLTGMPELVEAYAGRDLSQNIFAATELDPDSFADPYALVDYNVVATVYDSLALNLDSYPELHRLNARLGLVDPLRVIGQYALQARTGSMPEYWGRLLSANRLLLNTQPAAVLTEGAQTVVSIDWSDYPGVGLPLMVGSNMVINTETLIGVKPQHLNFPFAASRRLAARLQEDLPGISLSFNPPHLQLSYDRDSLLTAPPLPVPDELEIAFRDLFTHYYPPRLVKGAQFVDRVVTKIIEEGEDDPSISTITSRTAISGHQLRRHMARGGLNLRKIVERIRVQSAADKLTRTSAPVMNIAIEVGYSGQQALTKAFKRFFGLSPSEYRQLTNRTNMSRRDPLKTQGSGHTSTG